MAVTMLPGMQFEGRGGLWKVLQALQLYNAALGSKPPQTVTPEMRGSTGSLSQVLGQEDIAAGGQGLPQMRQGLNAWDWLKILGPVIGL